MKVKLILVGLLIVLAVTSVACAQPATQVPTQPAKPAATVPPQPTSAAKPAEPYYVGAVLSVTGGGAPAGENERKGVLLAVKQINAAGGIGGRPLEVLIEDDESDPTKAVAAFLKLSSDKRVSAILGPSTSTAAMAAIDTIKKGNVPVLAMVGAAQVVEAGKPNVFRVAPTDAVAVTAIMEHLSKKLKVSKLALLSTADAYSTGGADAIAALAPKYNIQIATHEKGQPTDTDFTPQLTKIKASGAEAVIVWFCGAPEIAASKNITQLGIKIPQIHATCVQKPYVDGAGASAEGVLFAGPKFAVASQLPESDAQSKAIQSFAKLYQTTYNEPPVLFSGFGWDATYLVAEALGRAKSGDPAAVKAALEQTKFTGTTGIYNWTASDHDGLGPESMAIIVIKSGNFAPAP
jgi:branched-chain amino acid transport system substrate-binding protein